jgi:hypothetical protein
MRCTVWLHDKEIGGSDLEFPKRGRQRAGIFRPTLYGLAVLPALTAVFPALYDFRLACERAGIPHDEESPDGGEAAMELLSATPEGERVVSAIRKLGDLELRDERGRRLEWATLMISDFEQIRAVAEHLDHRRDDARRESVRPAMPVELLAEKVPESLRYLLSFTLTRRRFVPSGGSLKS